MRAFSSPLLISISETSFQLSVDKDAVRALIRAGELVSVIVAGRELVVADSMRAFLKREAKRRNQERRDAVVASEVPKKAVTA